jgi:hypothetical protein
MIIFCLSIPIVSDRFVYFARSFVRLASFDITFAPNGAFVEASKVRIALKLLFFCLSHCERLCLSEQVAVYFNAAQKAAWGVDPSV